MSAPESPRRLLRDDPFLRRLAFGAGIAALGAGIAFGYRGINAWSDKIQAEQKIVDIHGGDAKAIGRSLTGEEYSTSATDPRVTNLRSEIDNDASALVKDGIGIGLAGALGTMSVVILHRPDAAAQAAPPANPTTESA